MGCKKGKHHHRWTIQEEKLIQKYLDTTWTLPTLYFKLFALDNEITFDSVHHRIKAMRKGKTLKKREDALSRLRVGYLDIETTHLKGNFGFMLSWYIKARGKRHYDFSVITKKEIFDEQFDLRLTDELLTALQNYDVLWAHWGADRRFDIPFIRTRTYAHNLQHRLPDKFEKFLMDTWPIARNKLCLHSNSLAAIGEALGIRGVKKTPLAPEKWRLAAVGNPDALSYIALHNKRDVQLLESIQRKLEKVDHQPYRSM